MLRMKGKNAILHESRCFQLEPQLYRISPNCHKKINFKIKLSTNAKKKTVKKHQFWVTVPLYETNFSEWLSHLMCIKTTMLRIWRVFCFTYLHNNFRGRFHLPRKNIDYTEFSVDWRKISLFSSPFICSFINIKNLDSQAGKLILIGYH